MKRQHRGIVLRACLLCCLSAVSPAADDDRNGTFSGTKTQWHSFDRHDFSLEGVACRVVVPRKVAAGHPWIWRARFWGHEPQTEIALLNRGFHVVYCDVAGLWGNEEAVRRWDRLYQYLTTKHEFSRRPALEGMSRGGLIVYRWAIRHPAQVSCIYADAPALGIRPYVRGLKEGDPGLTRLKAWMDAHDLTLQTAKKYTLDALDQLAPLAAARVPVMHVCGDADESVPFQEHTAEFARRYRKLGGPVRVIVKQGGKHHPHSLKDPAPVVDFIVASQSRVESPITHGPFVGHVTPASALVWARCQQAGEYRLIAQTTDGSRMSIAVARSAPEQDGCVHWKLTGLQPASRYHYRVEFQDRVLTSGEAFYLTTAASDPATSVRLVFGSCARVDEGSSAVWRRMQSLSPEAVVLLGDTPYIDSTSLDVQRQRYREFAAAPDFAALVRNRSLYGTWDDHDIGRNDTNGRLPGKENSRQVFAEYRANASCGDGQAGVYSRFRRGGVEVFLLDTRYFAATEPSPFDAKQTTLLGRQQWDWLRRGLKASTAPFKILACGMIWNDAVRPGKLDHWGTYPHELQALFDFIRMEQISGVVLVGGDIHRTRLLLHQTRDSAGYRIPELITSPIHDGVIDNARVSHPALLHDSGEPNAFLLVTADTRRPPGRLHARFVNSKGRTIFEKVFLEHDLKQH